MSRRRLVYGVLGAQIAVVVGFALTYNALDFFIYTLGGRAVGHDARLYLDQMAAHWFTYPPFAAVVFSPLGGVPLVVARVLWELASVAAFAWCCRLVLRLAGYRAALLPGVVVAGLFLEPVWHSLFLGQINLVLGALVLTDVWRLSRGRPAGIGIGLAAAIKLTPAIFIVVLLLAGRVRAAATATGTFLLCGLLGWLAAPVASRLYWTQLWHDTTRVHAGYLSNQSPFGAAARILHGPAHVGAWYVLVPVTVGVLGLAVAAGWARRGDWLNATAATGVTALLVSPISWSHHWVWALPVLVVFARDGRRSYALGGFALFVLAPMWWTPSHGEPAEYGFHGLTTLAANAYLLAGLVFLGYLTSRLAAARQGRGIDMEVAQR